jgi:hypothetical protein
MSDRTEAEIHPSFGVAIVTRTSAAPGVPMFQSDLLHREYISLRINGASRRRDLNHDWVHPERELVEVRMSLAQWGALVSSIGIGSGVPVTLVRKEIGERIPDPPFEPRMKANLVEVDEAVGKLLADAHASLAALTDAIEEKRGVKAIRSALSAHQSAVSNAKSNARFTVTSLTEAAEKVVSQARADIESSILAAVTLTGGHVSIESPTIPRMAEITAEVDPNE